MSKSLNELLDILEAFCEDNGLDSDKVLAAMIQSYMDTYLKRVYTPEFTNKTIH